MSNSSASRLRTIWLASVIVLLIATLIALTVRRDPGARVRARATPTPIRGGNFQASGVVHVPGSRQFLFVDDDTPDAIFAIELEPSGQQLGSAFRIPIESRVTDPEGMTWDGSYFYLVGSQSKLTGFEGDGLVRFRYDAVSGSISDVERIQGLKAWLAEHVAELRGTARQLGDHVLNIEGIGWDPRENRLLLGLRAPVVDGQTLIVPIRLERADAAFTTENLRIAGATIHLPLDGAGIRSIEFDGASGRFHIITGAELNEETLDFITMEWDGQPGTKPTVTGRFDRALKPEGFTTAGEEAGNLRVLVFDTGGMLVIRQQKEYTR